MFEVCLLQEGVVMVDSPGVGESRKLSRQLESYMTRAFGFIYVLNISNAGGIHRDRVSYEHCIMYDKKNSDDQILSAVIFFSSFH